MEPRRVFHLKRLKVSAWQIGRLPPRQRRQAGKALLQEIKHYLDKCNGNLPRSDV